MARPLRASQFRGGRPCRHFWKFMLTVFVATSTIGALLLSASVDDSDVSDMYNVDLGIHRPVRRVKVEQAKPVQVAPGFRGYTPPQHGDKQTTEGVKRVSSAAVSTSYNFKVILPSVVPVPSPLPPIYHTRGCECREDWREVKRRGEERRGQEGKGGEGKGEESICKCGGVDCPFRVDPPFLTDAVGQYVCSLREHTGYDCSTKCTTDGKIMWFAEGCGKPGEKPCPPLVASPSATPTSTPSAGPSIVVPRTTWVPEEVYDFRGGGCELLNGEKRCYMEDRQGRELCPTYVTLEYLTTGPPEYPQCRPENSHQYYCTIQCQDGNEVVRWGVHDIEDCHRKENFGNCPPRPTVVPKSQFVWRDWSEKMRPKTSCVQQAEMGIKGEMLPDITVGLLTHEPRSFADSMATYEKYGLFELVPEFIIYINNRGPDTDAVAERYSKMYPGKFKILGDGSNKGIARGMVELTNAATKPYFLFLERDFQLIEPSACVYEQLRAGVDLIKGKAADVIRYRSRWHAGRPNWALRFFFGHEDDAFRGRQPNLGCNVHYWVEHPDERWPQYVWKCGDDPEMLCTDSYYCNWTNNPQLWSVDWWNREYVSSFDKYQNISPWDDLELYMNWEPNSWNDRKFIVAQGEGLFKHMDRNNIVHV